MTSATGHTLAAFAFLAFVVLLPPLCYHSLQRNIPALSLIAWFCFDNITTFINSVIWSGENFDKTYEGEIYCDITVRIASGSSVGQICATACIIFNLYMIIAARNHGYLAQGSKTRMVVNLLMCWANPLLLMGLTVIPQIHRYDVARYYGCIAPYKLTLKAVMIVSVCNIFWIAVACTFAILTIFELARKRKDIQDILRCTNSGLNLRKFSRLIILSFLIVLVFSPVTLYSFVSDVKISQLTTPDAKEAYATGKWSDRFVYDLGMTNMSVKIVPMVFSFVTFFLFGLGTEALDMYRHFLVRIGFSSFKRNEQKDFHISKAFEESRQSTKQSEMSEETVGLSLLEYEQFQTLVLEKEPFSLLPTSDDKFTL